jgi:farnesyl-diphosphate farnesyltransferase
MGDSFYQVMLLENNSVIDIDRHTKSLLPLVSRTFALGIKLLPARLEMPVRLGYLLCRIADTVEDDLALSPERKAKLLDEFAGCFDDPHAADAFGDSIHELTSSDNYIDLVAATGEVFTLYRNLDVRTQAILRKWIEEMVRGMRRFVVEHPAGIRIGTVPEFHEYCYFVAGTVGHLLTDLWHHHSSAVDNRVYSKLLEDCEPFGEALQSVNILKDIAWDAERENSIYVPSELLAAQGSAHDLLLQDQNRAANRAALEPLCRIAQDDIERSLRYIENLPLMAVRIRLFCVLPVLFAVATMREIEKSEAMLTPGGVVKISRTEVKALIFAASTSTLTNYSLRWLVDRVRERPFDFSRR